MLEGSPGAGEFDGVEVVSGVNDPLGVAVGGEVNLLADDLDLLPLLPALGEAVALQHPHHLRHLRPLHRRALRAQQRHLDQLLHLRLHVVLQVRVHQHVQLLLLEQPLHLLVSIINNQTISAIGGAERRGAARRSAEQGGGRSGVPSRGA